MLQAQESQLNNFTEICDRKMYNCLQVREENRHAVGAGLEASVALANKAAMQVN